MTQIKQSLLLKSLHIKGDPLILFNIWDAGSARAIQENVKKIIEAGAVGINFEDQIVGGQGLYSIEEQCIRIKAVRDAAEQTSIPLFINARTDIFLKNDAAIHNNNHVNEALSRASAYAEAGASGFFVPGLTDAKYIEKICRLSPIPINVMALSEDPILKQFAELGVARISYGPHPYCVAINALKEAGRLAFSGR